MSILLMLHLDRNIPLHFKIGYDCGLRRRQFGLMVHSEEQSRRADICGRSRISQREQKPLRGNQPTICLIFLKNYMKTKKHLVPWVGASLAPLKSANGYM